MNYTKPTQSRAEIIAALPPVVATDDTYNDDHDHDNDDGMTPDEMFDALALRLTPETRRALYAYGAKARGTTVAPRSAADVVNAMADLSALVARLAPAAEASAVPRYVTLNQMAATVGRSKRTLEKYVGRKRNPLPEPDIQGFGGKANQWNWDTVRPWLEAEYDRTLREVFPAHRS